MQYYKNYIEELDLNFGKLEFINNKFYVNEEEVLNNRCIINDIVYIKNNEVVGIKERNLKNIIGILYLDSKIKYGSIKNKSLFLFKPTNKFYPNFYVPYNNNKINKIYVIIQFKEWKISDKMPIGQLIESLGDVGEKEIEIEHLRHFFEINNKVWKVDNKMKNDHLKILKDLEYKDVNYEIFSIDPIGSKDIDDAFHFNIKDKNDYEVGIHIASPTKFLENNLFDILNRVSTVYTSIKNYNLIPNFYSEEIVSLLEGKKRYSLSLILNICQNKIIKYELKETIVKNIKNYNYDEFDKIFKMNKNLNNFVIFTKDFFELEFIDSHKLVENWMILANKLVAKYLINNDLNNIILRVHDKLMGNVIDNNLKMEDELKNYIMIKNEKSALYKIYEKGELNQTHSKLGNNFYTHFTSPIRRSIDFFIHMLILKNVDILQKNELQKIVDKINIFTKNNRKFDRNIKRLEFLYNIKKNDENIITYGYIVKITKNKLTLYIPEYNLEEQVIIVTGKFEKIVEFNYKDDDIIENIEYIIDNIKKIYYLYQRLEIKLWVFTSFENIFDKLKIEIL